MSTAPKFKILMLAANPLNTTPLRLDEEQREIDHALRLSEYRNLFVLQAVFAVRIEDMRRAMLRFEPEIVHFSGHGQDGNIYLEDKNGNARAIASDALGDFFAIFPSVQCVLLNACFSEDLAGAITQTVPYVIGMQTEVQDASAISFATAFYDAIGAGGTFDRAFRIAANALKLEGSLDAANPVLVKKAESTSDVKAPALITPEASIALAAQPLKVTRLTGPQFKSLQEAILSTYTPDSLRGMVKVNLENDLDAIAGGSNFSAIVFNLIDWAQRTGRLSELIQSAAQDQPKSDKLQAFVTSLRDMR